MRLRLVTFNVENLVTRHRFQPGGRPDTAAALSLFEFGNREERDAAEKTLHVALEDDKRQMTALVWLNDEYEGGETHFPRLGITVRGAPGDMLVFANLDEHGKRDDRMEHAGLPVTRGEKWLASRWISVASQT